MSTDWSAPASPSQHQRPAPALALVNGRCQPGKISPIFPPSTALHRPPRHKTKPPPKARYLVGMFSRSVASSLLRRAARPAVRAPISPISFRAPISPLTPSQARLLSDATRSAIDKAVASAPVVLFMKGTPETPQCGFSATVIKILGMQGVNPDKFAAFNVLEDAELREGIKEYSDWPTIPQLYVDKEFVGGCDILRTMHTNGELAKFFEDKDVLVMEGDA
ncbi:monothiol glutaredoxin-5 [Metarhizium guizhouense ARSEF 977]|uniref:Monothiol glutaredoxin-5, mitochondrial n=1 Tax=Metarhizium guizhouense (strain ARSEF 977) TaxID=1276136 RepID=A0A0B4GPC8_METGA|nr:monothiol glutaredoxin-5 [Metarhizium guizhouense ARSEF 977]